MPTMQTKQYKVQAPDGTEHVIEGPDDATDDEILAQAKILFPEHAPENQPAQPPQTSRGATGDFSPTIGSNVINEVNGTADIVANSPIVKTLAAPVRELAKFGESAFDTGTGLISGGYHAAVDPLTSREQSRVFPQPDITGATKLPGLGQTNLEVLLHRMFYGPEQEDALKELSRKRQAGELTNSSDYINSIPVVGPAFNSVMDQYHKNGISGALGSIATMVMAPKATEEGVAGVKGVVADNITKPVNDFMDRRAAKAADLAAEKTANPQFYAPSLNTIAEATGNKASEAQFRDFADTWDTAAGEVKQSADKLFKGGITNNRQQIQAGKDAMDRIYNSEIGPKVALVESVDLKPLGEKLIREIPAQFTESERKAMTRFYQDQFNRTLTGPEMEQFRQKLTAASRLVLADSNYEQAAVTKSPAGFRLDAARDLVRDALANAVDKVQPGTDIRPSLAKYGKVTDLIQQAGGIPLDKTALELISGRSYITGTTPNITGRTVEALTKRWFANDNLIRRAYDQYKGPVVRPTSVPTGVNTLRGQQSDLIPHADGTTGAGSIPPAGSFGPLFESPMNQPMYRGDSISQQSKFGLRMPETMPPDSKPVNVLESLIPRPNGPTGLTTTNPLQHISVNGEFLSSEEFNRRFPNGLNAGRSPGQPMPAVTQSTRINPNQLYGPNPKLLSEGPFKFTIRGKPPDLVMEGAAGETPGKIKLTGNPPPGADPRLPSHYAQNWQLDSQTHGQPLTETYQGPGTLSTTDPKVVENTVASIQRYIEKNRPYGARLAELKQTQQDLLNQLKKFKASQPKGPAR